MTETPELKPASPHDFCLGVGDALGFSGGISPAKLALVQGLAEGPSAADGTPDHDGIPQILEVRIHGVGGSSPEELLEQPDFVQVGGDALAQFVRRRGTRRRTVPWALEGYWWGGLTSRPMTRALWSLLVPLLLCNLAAWAAPSLSGSRPSGSLPGVGRWLAVTLRWAGYVLTLVLTATVATASMDIFGWQCTGAGSQGSSSSCHVRWLTWVPSETGPRLALFALVPIVVVAAVGYACHRTVRSYERWRIGSAVEAAQGEGRPAWPLAASGFWHGLRPVRRLQLLHLAGAAGMVSLYLAWVPGSHHGWRTIAIIGALLTIGAPGLMLASTQADRPGSNPYATADSPAAGGDAGRFDRTAWAILGFSLGLLAAFLITRCFWQPQGPPTTGYPGVLPGDTGIWEWLSMAMGALVLAAFALTGTAKAIIARGRHGAQAATAADEAAFRPFTGGFLGPIALLLACVTGGIFAAGVNLALPRLLIGSTYKVGPAYTVRASAPSPVQLPSPLFAFMTALLAMAAALIILAVCYGFAYLVRGHATKKSLGGYYTDANRGSSAQRRRIARYWTVARAVDLIGLTFAVLSVAGLAGVIVFYAADPQRPVIASVAGTAQWLAGLLALAFYGFTVSSFTNQGKRRLTGVLWDVGTFWPRACQPFAPPCYMERSVPELVNRLADLLAEHDTADAVRLAAALAARLGPEVNQKELADELSELMPRYDKILLNGYSQGSFIAAAVLAQLPAAQVGDISLITVGCPLRRLYGRGFPVYFGPACLRQLSDMLGGPKVRWRNAVRMSDYIGGYVFADPYSAADLVDAGLVDKAVLDPPCVVPDDGDGATVPPIHGHLDFWPDPQVAVLTRVLVDAATGKGTLAEAPPQPPASVSVSPP